MAASDLPVMVDGDNGYGDVKNVVHVLHTYERLGVSAIMFEDQVAPKRCGHIAGKDVIPAAEMAAKIRAASQSKMNRDTFILARTDARDVHGLDEAFRRAELYLKNGADGIFIESPHDVAELETDREKIRRAADGQHAGRRPHADPDAERTRRHGLRDRDLWHLAADAHGAHHAGPAGQARARRRELHRQGRRLRGVQVDRRLSRIGRRSRTAI